MYLCLAQTDEVSDAGLTGSLSQLCEAELQALISRIAPQVLTHFHTTWLKSTAVLHGADLCCVGRCCRAERVHCLLLLHGISDDLELPLQWFWLACQLCMTQAASVAVSIVRDHRVNTHSSLGVLCKSGQQSRCIGNVEGQDQSPG